jgi:hypothetical protein
VLDADIWSKGASLFRELTVIKIL